MGDGASATATKVTSEPSIFASRTPSSTATSDPGEPSVAMTMRSMLPESSMTASFLEADQRVLSVRVLGIGAVPDRVAVNPQSACGCGRMS